MTEMNLQDRPSFALDRDGKCVVLFVDRAAVDRSEAAVACYRRMSWPSGWTTDLVDASERPDLVQWFGLRQFPALVVVADRSILAIEHECTEEACARVMALTGGRDAQLKYDVDGVFTPALKRACRGSREQN